MVYIKPEGEMNKLQVEHEIVCRVNKWILLVDEGNVHYEDLTARKEGEKVIVYKQPHVVLIITGGRITYISLGDWWHQLKDAIASVEKQQELIQLQKGWDNDQ